MQVSKPTTPAPPVADDAETEADEQPVTDPPAAELAQLFAEQLKADPTAAGVGLPPPRPRGDFNMGSFVRPSTELAAELPPFALSDDGKTLAFVRRERGLSSVWLAASDGSGARQVFDLATARLQLPEEDGCVEAPAAAIFDLQFSPDGTRLFFQTDGWQTSLALYGLELRTGEASFVVDANGYSVITACPKQPKRMGDIVAYRHSYETLLATALDAYFLIDSKGRKLGIIGEQPENVERFLVNACSLNSTIPVPPRPKISARLRSLPRCGGADQVLRYAPIRFLDGTEWPIFYVVKKSRAHTPRVTLDDVVSLHIPLDQLEGSLDEFCAGQ